MCEKMRELYDPHLTSDFSRIRDIANFALAKSLANSLYVPMSLYVLNLSLFFMSHGRVLEQSRLLKKKINRYRDGP